MIENVIFNRQKQVDLNFNNNSCKTTKRHADINLMAANLANDNKEKDDTDKNVIIIANSIKSTEKVLKAVVHAEQKNPQRKVKNGTAPLITSHSNLALNGYLKKQGLNVISQSDAAFLDTSFGERKGYIESEYGDVTEKYNDENAEKCLNIAKKAHVNYDVLQKRQRTNDLITIVDRVMKEG